MTGLVLAKIISGGQTGADQGALRAAVDLGLATGGWMPKGWRTDAGPRPEFELMFRMKQHAYDVYPPRTFANVSYADATFIFGNLISKGSMLTKRYVAQTHKPIYVVPWQSKADVKRDEKFVDWLIHHRVRILNVAGNRERTNPGIHGAIRFYLLLALQPHLKDQSNASQSYR